jgi:hypothetical protein
MYGRDAQVQRARNVELKEWDSGLAGCNGMSLLVKYLPYTHYTNVHVVPVGHAILLGVLKDFWTLLLCKRTSGKSLPRYALPMKHRKVMENRRAGIVLNCDFGRPYRCAVKNRGNWVMEDWLNWLDVYSVYVLQPFKQVSVSRLLVCCACLSHCTCRLVQSVGQ